MKELRYAHVWLTKKEGKLLVELLETEIMATNDAWLTLSVEGTVPLETRDNILKEIDANRRLIRRLQAAMEDE